LRVILIRGTVCTSRAMQRGRDSVADLFHHEQHREGDTTVLVFRGELDMASAPEAFEILIAAIREGDVVIDASELSFIDSSGIRSLVEAQREANRGIGADRVVSVRNPSAPVRRVLEVTGLDALIDSP
jgi:anti-anti-sigma factor